MAGTGREYPLGRRRPIDPRNALYPFKAEAALAAAPLVSVRHPRRVPVFDQGNVGSCTGNAALGALGTGLLWDALKAASVKVDFSQETALSLYREATRLDQWPGSFEPDDTGSDGPSAAKAARNRGWLSGYQHAVTPDDALAALTLGPVITGVDWYDGFYDVTSTGEMRLRGLGRGGHEVVVDTLDLEGNRVWITNSWGTDWGIDGRAWWTIDTWKTLLSTGGDAVAMLPVTAPTPAPVEPGGSCEEAGDILWALISEWAAARHARSNKTAAKAATAWAKATGRLQ